MRSSALRLAVAILMVALLVFPAFADLTGDVQGTVTDATGAGVGGATVSIKNVSTGATRSVITSPAGEYSAPQLEVGDYEITIEKANFKSFSQKFVVRSGEKTRLDAQLQINPTTPLPLVYWELGLSVAWTWAGPPSIAIGTPGRA
jgi:hypothetical protein